MSLENFIYESIDGIFGKDYEEAKSRIIKHKEIYNDDTAICFSLLALGAFVRKQYDEYYQLMKDAQF